MCHALACLAWSLHAQAQETPQPVPPTPAAAIMDVQPGAAEMPQPVPEPRPQAPAGPMPSPPQVPAQRSQPALAMAPAQSRLPEPAPSASAPARLMLSLPELDALIKAARQSGGRMTVEVKLEGVTAEDLVVPLAQSGLVTVSRAGDTYIVRPRNANRQAVSAEELQALEARRKGLLADISSLEALVPKEAQ